VRIWIPWRANRNEPCSLRNKCSVSSLRLLAINLCCTHHICGVSWCRGCRVERVPSFECTRVLTLTVCAVTIHGVRSGIRTLASIRRPEYMVSEVGFEPTPPFGAFLYSCNYKFPSIFCLLRQKFHLFYRFDLCTLWQDQHSIRKTSKILHTLPGPD